jgi:hypothetical protein
MKKNGRRGAVVGKIALLAGLVLLFPLLLNAADFPTKPISLIVPYAGGGATDMVARALARRSPPNNFRFRSWSSTPPAAPGLPAGCRW